MLTILRGFVCWNGDVSKIQSPYLASVQKVGEEHNPKDHDFVSYAEAVIDEEPVRERSVRSISRFCPILKVSLAGDIRNDAN